jgi:monoterpene epsilon-lactone hydrolase
MVNTTILYIIKKITRLVRPSNGIDYLATRKMLDVFGTVLSFLSWRSYNLSKVSANNVPAEWNIPKNVVDKRVMMYLHGGAYVAGSLKSHRELVFRFARAVRARALAIDYRLAPEHPYPAALEDAVAAYTYLLDIGTDSADITIIGDSAGGGLALALLQELRAKKIPLPACATCLSPWTDLTGSGETMQSNSEVDPMLTSQLLDDDARYYANGMDLKNPTISPLFGTFIGLPPILIQVGTDEILLDDSRRLVELVKKADSEIELEIWPKMFHVWHIHFLLLSDARKAINKISQFVEKHMKVRV